MYFEMKWITLSKLIVVATVYCRAAQASAGDNRSILVSGRSEELFSKAFYVGSEAQGIVRLYYLGEKPLWKRHPRKCYGILVNWQKAVVPCSCVSYTEKYSDTRSPFNYYGYRQKRGSREINHGKRKHGKRKYIMKAKMVTVMNYSDVRVGIMRDEYDSRRNQTNLVNVTKIRIHPKCDSFYNVNYATLDLESKIEGSRLIWVNQAVKRRLAAEIEFTAIASAMSGECFVVRWVDKKLSAASSTERRNHPPFEWLRSSTSTYKTSLSAKDKSDTQLMLMKDYVSFTSWDTCLNNVCPPEPHLSAYVRKNDTYCTNKINGKRWCLQWTANSKLCGQPEGTPVFCHVREFNGIMGLLYNTPFNCDQRSKHSGIMASFEEALDLVKYDLPLTHSVRYLHSLPSEYDEYFKDPILFHDLQNDAASLKSFNIALIMACTTSLLGKPCFGLLTF